MEQHTFIFEEVRIGKKGQITIPKKIRDEDGLKEDDKMSITHMPSGDIIIQKTITKSPEDYAVEAIERHQRFDWRKVWKEVVIERRRSDR